jgi:hypothetical protein
VAPATAIGVGFVVWGWAVGLGRLADNSFFTHLATGRLILDEGFPRADVYSFTAPGEPWVVQSWLASILYGLVDGALGGDGLRLLTAVLTAALAGLTWRLTRPAEALIPRVALTALVTAVGAAVWSPRPLLIGLLFLALSLLVAEGTVPPWALLPAFWVWANSHGSFPLGLVALACLALGAWLDERDTRPTTELRALGWALAGTLAAVIGPLGPAVLVFPIRLLQRQEVLAEVIEWQSPSFADGWARLFLVQVALGVVGLVRRPSWRAAVPFVVFLAAALLASRNVAVASLVLVPGSARGLAGLGTVTGRDRSRTGAAIFAAVVALAMVATLARLAEPAYDLRTYPVDAVSWLAREGWLDAGARMASQETVGNYLELVRGADAEVFIDDRVDMYPEAVTRDFLTLLRGRPGWQRVLAERRVDVVLWQRSEPLAQLLAEDPGWRAVYADPAWGVWCRRGSDAVPGRC